MKLTKIFVILLMAVFVIGMLPLVSAQKETKAWNEEAKQRVEAAKELYEKAKEEYRSNLEEYKNKTKQDREQHRQEMLNAASDRLSRHIDVLLSILEKAKTKFAENNVTDSEILTKLDTATTKLTAVQTSLDGNLTKEELRQKILEVKEAWKEARGNIGLGVEKIKENSLGNVLGKVEQLQGKFNKTVERLNDKNVSTEKLESYLADFDAKVADASAKYEEASKVFEQAKDAETAEEKASLIKQAQNLKAEALSILKEIREDLRNIVEEIRDAEKEGKKESKKEENESLDDSDEDSDDSDKEEDKE